MRIRLILSFSLIVLVTLASVALIARLNTAQEIDRFMGRGGLFGLDSMVLRLESYYRSHGSWQGVASAIRTPGNRNLDNPGDGFSGGNPRSQFQLIDIDGNIVFDTHSSNNNTRYSPEQLEHAVVLQVMDEVVGYLRVEGGIKISPEVQKVLVERINDTAQSAALIAGGIALVLALILATQFLRPIQDLTQAATRLAQGELSYRAPVRGSDELSSLAKTFNHMASSLEGAEESRKALTADIAHELRTPLAVQRAHLEALQDGVFELTIENLTAIVEQNFSLEHMVEDLRTLALAEAGQLIMISVPTDFSALISRSAQRFRPGAGSRSIEIILPTPGACPIISLDPQRVEQIINNLLSNALRYSPESETITLALHCTNDCAVLTVRDRGPGIPIESLSHVFERFYKSDKARLRSESGTGLGLSIARKLAQAHGGELEAANHPDGGAIFTLTFPL